MAAEVDRTSKTCKQGFKHTQNRLQASAYVYTKLYDDAINRNPNSKVMYRYSFLMTP